MVSSLSVAHVATQDLTLFTMETNRMTTSTLYIGDILAYDDLFSEQMLGPGHIFEVLFLAN